MEEALLYLEQERKHNVKNKVSTHGDDRAINACQMLAKALHDYCVTLSQTIDNDDVPNEHPASKSSASDKKDNTSSTAAWLYNLCTTIPSPLGTKSLASAILCACQHKDEMQIQAALFDTLGEGERAMEVLFEIVPRAKEIRVNVTEDTLNKVQNHGQNNNNVAFSSSSAVASIPAASIMDPEQERLNLLRQQVIEATEFAALTKAEADAIKASSNSNSHTHTITRSSDKEIIKQAKQAAKAASKALTAAIEAGAIVDENDMISRGYNSSALAAEEAFFNSENVALHKMNQYQYEQLQSELLPEGTREYHEQKGLPRGTERVVCDGYEKVTIPAKVLNPEQLHSRIVISEVMHSNEQKAFAGTKSLNPMQSTVFEAAFHSNENLLIW